MVCLSASFFRRSPLALGRWLPTFRAMVAFSPLKNSHSRTISRRMPAHVGAGVPANIKKHRGLSPRSYDVALGRSNHLYSIAALTDSAKNVVERYRYSAYGERTVLAPDGVTTRATSSYKQQVGFTGRYLDKETGLWLFRARYYSGSLGRFIGRDQKGYVNGIQLYGAYFIPNHKDPSGNQVCCKDQSDVFLWDGKECRCASTEVSMSECKKSKEPKDKVPQPVDPRYGPKINDGQIDEGYEGPYPPPWPNPNGPEWGPGRPGSPVPDNPEGTYLPEHGNDGYPIINPIPQGRLPNNLPDVPVGNG